MILRYLISIALVACHGSSALAMADSRDGSESRPVEGVLRVEGRVITEAGSPVMGARIRFLEAERERVVTTDAEGCFVVELVEPGAVVLTVEAEGYETASRRVAVDSGSRPPPIILRRALREEVTVTATRIPTKLSETASSVAVVSSEDLSVAGAARLDDALRAVPGFQLLRRSGSRTANPTSQGVSLRGVGASGASRALVLDDGIPLNDPFGGWVYWGRLPWSSLERVEVLRGGASDPYGSSALSGVVSLVRRKEDRPFLSAEASYGSQSTSDLSLSAGGRSGRWGGVLAAKRYETGGYIPVAEEERGEVDRPAGTRDAAVDLTGTLQVSDGNRLFLRGSWFDESRANGTRLQSNDTRLEQMSAGWNWHRDGSAFALRLHGSRQDYEQSFSAVSADRDSETLTRLQDVPTRARGAGFQWTGGLGDRQTIAFGSDYRSVTGTSHERIFTPSGVSTVRAGGRQEIGGIFVEDVLTLAPAVSVSIGARYDLWENEDAARTTDGSTVRFPDRRRRAVSPRVSLVLGLGPDVSLTAAAYQAFRAPTLNELYRSFRIGDRLTLANENLEAERLKGAETGLVYASGGGRAVARGTLFWMIVDDPIANVTLSVTPGLTTLERKNLSRLRSRGAELEAEARPGPRWALSGGYLFADSVIEEFPADPDLEGQRTPQVPRHQITFQARYDGPSAGTFGLQARWASAQFEDDRNTLVLDRYAVMDVLWSRPIARRALAIFLAGENLLDARYDIGRTPARLLGSPRTLRGGIRLTLPE